MSVKSDVAVIFRFLGWLKGFIHDRNHSTENLVRGYGRVTVIRREPSRIRTAIVQRYASNQLVLPKSSFLALPDNRMQRRSRAGRHEVQVRLSRRNHKIMVSIRQEEPRLERLLKTEFGDLHTTARTIRFTTSTGVKCDGFPVTKGVWFGFDPHSMTTARLGLVVLLRCLLACLIQDLACITVSCTWKSSWEQCRATLQTMLWTLLVQLHDQLYVFP